MGEEKFFRLQNITNNDLIEFSWMFKEIKVVVLSKEGQKKLNYIAVNRNQDLKKDIRTIYIELVNKILMNALKKMVEDKKTDMNEVIDSTLVRDSLDELLNEFKKDLEKQTISKKLVGDLLKM